MSSTAPSEKTLDDIGKRQIEKEENDSGGTSLSRRDRNEQEEDVEARTPPSTSPSKRDQMAHASLGTTPTATTDEDGSDDDDDTDGDGCISDPTTGERVKLIRTRIRAAASNPELNNLHASADSTMMGGGGTAPAVDLVTTTSTTSAGGNGSGGQSRRRSVATGATSNYASDYVKRKYYTSDGAQVTEVGTPGGDVLLQKRNVTSGSHGLSGRGGAGGGELRKTKSGPVHTSTASHGTQYDPVHYVSWFLQQQIEADGQEGGDADVSDDDDGVGDEEGDVDEFPQRDEGREEEKQQQHHDAGSLAVDRQRRESSSGGRTPTRGSGGSDLNNTSFGSESRKTPIRQPTESHVSDSGSDKRTHPKPRQGTKFSSHSSSSKTTTNNAAGRASTPKSARSDSEVSEKSQTSQSSGRHASSSTSSSAHPVRPPYVPLQHQQQQNFAQLPPNYDLFSHLTPMKPNQANPFTSPFTNTVVSGTSTPVSSAPAAQGAAGAGVTNTISPAGLGPAVPRTPPPSGTHPQLPASASSVVAAPPTPPPEAPIETESIEGSSSTKQKSSPGGGAPQSSPQKLSSSNNNNPGGGGGGGGSSPSLGMRTPVRGNLSQDQAQRQAREGFIKQLVAVASPHMPRAVTVGCAATGQQVHSPAPTLIRGQEGQSPILLVQSYSTTSSAKNNTNKSKSSSSSGVQQQQQQEREQSSATPSPAEVDGAPSSKTTTPVKQTKSNGGTTRSLSPSRLSPPGSSTKKQTLSEGGGKSPGTDIKARPFVPMNQRPEAEREELPQNLEHLPPNTPPPVTEEPPTDEPSPKAESTAAAAATTTTTSGEILHMTTADGSVIGVDPASGETFQLPTGANSSDKTSSAGTGATGGGQSGGGSNSREMMLGTTGVNALNSLLGTYHNQVRALPEDQTAAFGQELEYFVDTFLVLTQQQRDARYALIERVETLCKAVLTPAEEGGEVTVKVHGSFASGLSLASSDVDFSISGYSDAPRYALDKVATAFAKYDPTHGPPNPEDLPSNTANLEATTVTGECFEVTAVPYTRVPVVKIVERFSYLRADISFGGGDNEASTMMANRLVQEHQPHAKRLIMLLKYLVKENRFGEMERGGVTSFVLTLLISHFFQERERIKRHEEESAALQLQEQLQQQHAAKNVASFLAGEDDDEGVLPPPVALDGVDDDEPTIGTSASSGRIDVVAATGAGASPRGNSPSEIDEKKDDGENREGSESPSAAPAEPAPTVGDEGTKSSTAGPAAPKALAPPTPPVSSEVVLGGEEDLPSNADILPTHPSDSTQPQENLGKLFIEFCSYWGSYFDYLEWGVRFDCDTFVSEVIRKPDPCRHRGQHLHLVSPFGAGYDVTARMHLTREVQANLYHCLCSLMRELTLSSLLSIVAASGGMVPNGAFLVLSRQHQAMASAWEYQQQQMYAAATGAYRGGVRGRGRGARGSVRGGPRGSNASAHGPHPHGHPPRSPIATGTGSRPPTPPPFGSTPPNEGIHHGGGKGATPPLEAGIHGAHGGHMVESGTMTNPMVFPPPPFHHRLAQGAGNSNNNSNPGGKGGFVPITNNQQHGHPPPGGAPRPPHQPPSPAGPSATAAAFVPSAAGERVSPSIPPQVMGPGAGPGGAATFAQYRQQQQQQQQSGSHHQVGPHGQPAGAFYRDPGLNNHPAAMGASGPHHPQGGPHHHPSPQQLQHHQHHHQHHAMAGSRTGPGAFQHHRRGSSDLPAPLQHIQHQQQPVGSSSSSSTRLGTTTQELTPLSQDGNNKGASNKGGERNSKQQPTSDSSSNSNPTSNKKSGGESSGNSKGGTEKSGSSNSGPATTETSGVGRKKKGGGASKQDTSVTPNSGGGGQRGPLSEPHQPLPSMGDAPSLPTTTPNDARVLSGSKWVAAGATERAGESPQPTAASIVRGGSDKKDVEFEGGTTTTSSGGGDKKSDDTPAAAKQLFHARSGGISTSSPPPPEPKAGNGGGGGSGVLTKKKAAGSSAMFSSTATEGGSLFSRFTEQSTPVPSSQLSSSSHDRGVWGAASSSSNSAVTSGGGGGSSSAGNRGETGSSSNKGRSTTNEEGGSSRSGGGGKSGRRGGNSTTTNTDGDGGEGEGGNNSGRSGRNGRRGGNGGGGSEGNSSRNGRSDGRRRDGRRGGRAEE